MAATIYTAVEPYPTLTYAKAYFLERLDTTVWDAATDDTKTKALKQATVLLDTVPFVGSKYDPDHVRQFPRAISWSLDEFVPEEDDGTVPVEILQATCEVALALLQGNTLEKFGGGSGIASESIGDASTSYTANGKNALLAENYGLPSPMAARMIAPWVKDDNIVELQRVS